MVRVFFAVLGRPREAAPPLAREKPPPPPWAVKPPSVYAETRTEFSPLRFPRSNRCSRLESALFARAHFRSSTSTYALNRPPGARRSGLPAIRKLPPAQRDCPCARARVRARVPGMWDLDLEKKSSLGCRPMRLARPLPPEQVGSSDTACGWVSDVPPRGRSLSGGIDSSDPGWPA